ncbi:ribonuclease P protein component [Sanguibacteroides justesenii]|uniref:Ribonuclease P protein component n=1 Tax=Sanguibacteroides justesenii TaxID=1547597 RepID=A0A0C3MDL3_9PORP|nr:ribonuclease P protein component [Sanguibacteroides justesenii]KIO44498.1 ribonuclease P [Sanguibacteroides justesenii]KIO45245.1 ribonuclease P [Sanguibacteroides justesenii]PXZ44535.1 ribonuclease P protein component [Sanguibacteroides justesenii]
MSIFILFVIMNRETIGYTFCKAERLCSRSRFERLLSSGFSFISYPLRVIVYVSEREEEEFPARMAISVSKKRFKRAVKRNRVKRLVREAYRLNKFRLYENIPENETWNMLFIYLNDSIVKYDKIEKAITGAFKKMETHIKKDRDRNVVDTP